MKVVVKRIFRRILRSNLSHILPDKNFIRIKYRLCFGRSIDLDNPMTFNEKLQWLKLNDHSKQYVDMVDKYTAKEYVKNILGDDYIIPNYGVWDSFDSIDFNKLPNKFVLKSTHDSGGVVICSDKAKFDIAKAKHKINRSLKNNYFYQGREWPYKFVKPRIIAEQFISEEMIDYKIHCFNGEPKMTLVCSERFSNSGLKEDFYDLNWNRLNVRRPSHPNSTRKIEKPINYEKMLEMSRVLSKDIPFLRVDFYEIDGKVYFGELTFYPANGFEGFVPNSMDYELGEMLDLHKQEV